MEIRGFIFEIKQFYFIFGYEYHLKFKLYKKISVKLERNTGRSLIQNTYSTLGENVRYFMYKYNLTLDG